MIVEDDIIFSGWTTAKLGDICKTTSGGTPNRSESRYYNGNIPWVKSGELDNGTITDTEEKITEEGLQNSSAKIFPKGTLLIALYGATIGKLAFLGVNAATNQAVCGIYENQNLDSKYLFYYLTFRKRELVKQAIGGAQPNISQGILRNLEIPIPSKPLQGTIVSKIEELFSELDKAVESLRTTQQQLKTYRQSVLKWAFEGKLTNEHVKEGELPEGWQWKSLGELCAPNRKCSYGVLVPGEHVEGGVSLVRVGDIDDAGNVSHADIKKIAPEIANKFRRTFLQGGEVLITLVGAIGRTAVAPRSLKGANTARAVGVIPISEKLSSKFVEAMLRSPAKFREHNQKAHEVARKTLNLEDVVSSKIPLPSSEVQKSVANEIESRFSVADKLEESINQSLQQAETLRQSILKKAFEGKLV